MPLVVPPLGAIRCLRWLFWEPAGEWTEPCAKQGDVAENLMFGALQGIANGPINCVRFRQRGYLLTDITCAPPSNNGYSTSLLTTCRTQSFLKHRGTRVLAPDTS